MIDIRQWDETATPSRVAEPVQIKRESVIFNGYYTLTFPDQSHKTFRIATKAADARFAPGKRIISILIGPDNTSDYEPFGFVFESGIVVWKGKRGAVGRPSKMEEYAALIWDIAVRGDVIEGYTLEVSRRCQRCNRPLTDPASLARGVGPFCDKILE